MIDALVLHVPVDRWWRKATEYSKSYLGELDQFLGHRMILWNKTKGTLGIKLLQAIKLPYFNNRFLSYHKKSYCDGITYPVLTKIK